MKVKRRLGFYGLLVLLCIVFCPGKGAADEIVLDNGNTLTGKVVKAQKDTLTLSTAFSRPIIVNTSTIRKISTDGEVSYTLKTERCSRAGSGRTSRARSWSNRALDGAGRLSGGIR